MEKEKAYMEHRMDWKKIWLLYWERIWLLIVVTASAAAIGAGVYRISEALNDEGQFYRVSSDYYITFNEDENGVDYYNAYTWDTILRDDPVVDVVMENLPDTVSKDEVKAAVTGEMLGDYRILTVHATSKDPQFAEMVAEAYIKGLSQFADKISMLDTIELWSQENVMPVTEDDLTANAALLGALLGFVAGIILCAVHYILDDSVYVETDFTECYDIPFLGMITRKGSEACRQELRDNLSYLLKEGEYYFVFAAKNAGKEQTEPADKGNPPKDILVKEIQDGAPSVKGILSLQGEDLTILRKSNGAVLAIPWGSKNGRVVEKTVRFLRKQDCKIAGAVIYDAEDAFLRKYYGIRK